MSERTCYSNVKSNFNNHTNHTVILSTRVERKITWFKIAEEIKAGKANTLFSIGDEIIETLTTGEEVSFVISGINIFKENEVIFTLKDCLKKPEECIDRGRCSSDENHIHDLLNNEIFDTLPIELRKVISPRVIDGKVDLLWMLSQYEVFGEEKQTSFRSDSDNQFPYYKYRTNRIKGHGKGTVSCYIEWWLRPNRLKDGSVLMYTRYDGYPSTCGNSSPCGICFGFCI